MPIPACGERPIRQREIRPIALKRKGLACSDWIPWGALLPEPESESESLASASSLDSSPARGWSLKLKSLCDKCGEPISFKRLENQKWCPTNLDGSDHWDICKRIALKKSGKKLLVRELRYMTVPLGKMPIIVSDVPPWDESIVEDWSWCRGSKTVGVEVELEYAQP